ncbi:hypothetical protein [Armatimonas sp.]|uniref:hypothetical protein n=1 Tax=Armatimonas sp. TaxID=1872638 RepID=UPI00286BE1F4|nr:hypothetical protein [Armatimonas sp.]
MNAPIEYLLAGYTVEKDRRVLLQDPRTGYILVRMGECDGAHKSVSLYPNLTEVAKRFGPAWTRSQVFPRKPLSLETGRGVKIGDRPEQVFRKMGKPTRKGGSLQHADETVWSYHHVQGSHEKGAEYISRFRFRRDRVTGIELLREAIPGC